MKPPPIRKNQNSLVRVRAVLPGRAKVRGKVNPISKPPAPDKAGGGEKGSRNPASRKGRDRRAAKGKAKGVGKASQAVNAKPPKLTVRAIAAPSPPATAAATARPADAVARRHR